MVPGAPTPDPRATRNAQKQARFKKIAEGQALPRVRVLPANEDVRRVLRHPRGMKFRSVGSVEWPLDKFTGRMLRDGAITLEEKHESHRDELRGSPPPSPKAPV